MRDVYHCPPSVMDEQDDARFRLDAYILSQTLEYRELQARRAAQGRK